MRRERAEPAARRVAEENDTSGRPLRPSAPAEGHVRRSFTRGRASPRGVVWFGFQSFWGHLRHLVASAIATEDIDSRDWMTPDEPRALADRLVSTLGGQPSGSSVVEGLGRDLWIDYVSDTGDDASVSAAVARLMVAEYELPDPDRPEEHLVAPRGDVLLFGGDTAYPVATAQEIMNRVLVPFNQVLEERRDGRPRVLLGIPGNHDWYDGLDGFGRMFRRRESGEEEPRPSVVGVSKRMLERYGEWAREFVRGGKVEKPAVLVLSGYTPIQSASYFILPLTSSIHMTAVDRQLKALDDRQRRFHMDWHHRHGDVASWVLLPDPLYHFGVPSRTGTEMIQALGLDFDAREHFLLSGDVHHYERLAHDRVLHVIAGGGGAFLHPAPMVDGRLRADVRWPSLAQSRVLLAQVPWRVALGRAGFLPHVALAIVFTPAILFGVRLYDRLGLILSAPIAIFFVVGILYLLIGGVRKNLPRIAALAFGAAALTASVPVVASLLLGRLLARLHYQPGAWAMAAVSLIVAIFAGAWIFGLYVALLTRLGLEMTQGFAALDHPGFKHFLRLRVRADGKGVDAWCLGLLDPLRDAEPPVLVDHFHWKP
jgi:hypothetical protein